MSVFVPFVAHIKVVPSRLQRGKRFELVRDLQRLGTVVFEELDDIPSINIAEPGGGQHRNFGRFSDLQYGTAVKPQIGNTPAQLMITGFINFDIANEQPHPNTQLIHGHVDGVQASQSGPKGNQSWLGLEGNPTADVEAEVITLKALIDGALASVTDSTGNPVTLFRLDYKNIIWGDRGHTFPQ